MAVHHGPVLVSLILNPSVDSLSHSSMYFPFMILRAEHFKSTGCVELCDRGRLVDIEVKSRGLRRFLMECTLLEIFNSARMFLHEVTGIS